MVAHLATLAGGLGLLLALSTISVGAGRGLLRLLAIRVPEQAALTLAACVALALWSISLGILEGLKVVPLKYAVPALWLVTLLLAVNGVRRPWPPLRSGPALGASLAASLIVMAPYFWNGLTEYQGSIAPDGWSYVAYGQYLWDQVRGADGGLSPLQQFAAHLSGTRFISASLLAFVSPLNRPGDTAAVKALVQAWTLFIYGCAVAFFWTTVGWSRSVALLLVLMSIANGWIADLTWANNLDNGLALIYAPSIAGTLRMMIAGQSRRVWTLFGGLCAGLLYSYPELAIPSLVAAGCIALPAAWRERHRAGVWGTAVAAGTILSLVLIAPFAAELVTFVIAQFTVTTGSARPGEGYFDGLVNQSFEPSAWWGLGGEHRLVLEHQNAVGGMFCILAMVGAIGFVQAGEWGLVAATGFLGVGALYFLLQEHYPYAAYKFIVLDWWLLAGTVAGGAVWLSRLIARVDLRRAALGLIAAASALLLLEGNHTDSPALARYFDSPDRPYSLAQYSRVATVASLTQGSAILVLVDDWLANEWATYYLRDTPAELLEYRMYMDQPHVIPFMQRSKAVAWADAHYVLTDATYDATFDRQTGWHTVWSNEPYRLWGSDAAAWAVVTNVVNLNGVERVDGEQFFWMGKGDSQIDVLTNRSGMLDLAATFLVGPSVPEKASRTILVTTATGFVEQVNIGAGEADIIVPVSSGRTSVSLRAIDQPTVSVAANGDTRPLVVGVKGLTAHMQDSAQVAPADPEHPA